MSGEGGQRSDVCDWHAEGLTNSTLATSQKHVPPLAPLSTVNACWYEPIPSRCTMGGGDLCCSRDHVADTGRVAGLTFRRALWYAVGGGVILAHGEHFDTHLSLGI